jgi:hypothetical protein
MRDGSERCPQDGMKQTFAGYYTPTAAEYERLWKEGLVVLDTNVLLDLYRLPTATRDELFGVLELFKNRLWIPHQVGLEFQRRRLGAISTERDQSGKTLESANQLVDELSKAVGALEIDKRKIGVQSQPILDQLRAASAKVVEAISAVQNSQIDVSASDPVREKLDRLFEGRVGAAPAAQAELDALMKGGDERFAQKIPPGWADADKEKNPAEATFIYDHMRYQRKFGDLILWRQLIAHAKQSGIKCVLFVTRDTKEDWWWRERGRTIGPQPELVREIVRDGGVELFWMYNSVQFVQHAPRYTQAQVSAEAVNELKEIAEADSVRVEAAPSPADFPEPSEISANPIYALRRYLERLAVKRWIEQTEGPVVENEGFPDFIVPSDSGRRGFEIHVLTAATDTLITGMSLPSLRQGAAEIANDRLDEFTLALAVPKHSWSTDTTGVLRYRIKKMVAAYPGRVVIGIVEEGSFLILIDSRRFGPDQP